MDWKHGYFADGGYTYGYYAEMSPARIGWLAALRGYRLPLERFRYLDLGCGQGLHLAMLAALHPNAEFVGVDFMPGHVAHARQLVAAAGLGNVRLIEADFLDLQNDLSVLGASTQGGFDMAVAHGISTWVGPEVREALFRVASTALNPGGFFYNSYNTLPGWLDALPFQNLVKQLNRRLNGSEALQLSRELMAALQASGSALFSSQPLLQQRLAGLATKNPAYLVQEYNNQFWQPVHCAEMISLAQRHKLDFVCSATIPEQFDSSYRADVLQLLQQQPDVLLRETVRDLALCQPFRRDLYVKGGAPLWPGERLEHLSRWMFVAPGLAAVPSAGEPFAFNTSCMALSGKREACLKLLEAIGPDGACFGDLAARLDDVPPAQLLQRISLLLHGGWLAPAVASDPTGTTLALNAALLRGILAGAPYSWLGLPRAAAAVALPEQDLLLLALAQEGCGPAELAQGLVLAMARFQKQFADGGDPNDPKQVLAHAERLVQPFLQTRLPVYAGAGLSVLQG